MLNIDYKITMIRSIYDILTSLISTKPLNPEIEEIISSTEENHVFFFINILNRIDSNPISSWDDAFRFEPFYLIDNTVNYLLLYIDSKDKYNTFQCTSISIFDQLLRCI